MAGRRLGQRLVRVGAVVACLAQASPAFSEEKARLVYVRGGGAEECPDEAKLRQWVAARLGYDPFDAQASNVVIARVEARERELQSSVEVIDARGAATGRRELSSPEASCQALARALALSISLAIDPERAQSRPEPSEADAPPTSEPVAPAPLPAPEPAPPPPVASPEPPPPSEPVPAPAPVVDRAPPQREMPGVIAGAAFASNVGALPAPALGALIGVSFRFPRWSLALEGRGLQSFERDVEPRGQASGSVVTGGASVCFHYRVAAACLVGQGGLQRLVGSGVTNGRTSSGQYWAVGPRLLGKAAIARRLALTGGLEGSLNLAPNRAVLTGQEVWEAPWLAATLLLGLEAHLP